jgi:hypothetical protein
MKTSEQLKKEVDDLIFEGKSLDKFNKDERKRLTKIKSRIKYLKPLIIYLETNPTKDFCLSELNKAESKYHVSSLGFEIREDLPKSVLSKLKKEYDKHKGIDNLKKQIQNLKFILS